MIIETVRFVADTLAHVTWGVDAKVAAISLDGTDARPGALASIQNEFDDNIIARRHVPEAETTPFLAVFQPREAELSGWVTTEVLDAEDLPVAIVVVEGDVDSADANLNAGYYVRCVLQSLNAVATGDASRTRNNVQILNHRNAVLIAPFVQVGDAVFTRGVILGFQSRDLTP